MRDGGIIWLYSLMEISRPGEMSIEALIPTGSAFYAYRTAGVTRRYQAKGANAEFDYLVRCFNMSELPAGTQYAILDDGTGDQYQIDIAEPMVDENALDLTLIRLGELYAVATE